MGLIDEYYLLSEFGQTSVMVFPIGQYKTAKYPKLSLTREMADAIIQNFNGKVLGATEPFIDSSGRHDEGAPAAGWIKALFIRPWKNGEALFADVEWTPVGQKLVRDKLYKYLSPVIAPHTIPETGEEVYPVLRSMSLTNIPVLRMMPAVEASEQQEFMEIACSELMKVEEVMNDEPVTEVTETPVEEPAAEVTEEPVAETVEEPEAEEETPEPAAEEEVEEPNAETVAETDEDIVEQMLQILSKLNTRTKYKRGAPALRALMKEVIAKTKATAASEDDVLEAFYTILAEVDESGKEMNNMMDKLIEKFGLAEDATEDDVIALYDAKVVELTEAKDTLLAEKEAVEASLAETAQKLAEAEATLADAAREAHVAEIEHKLSDAVNANLILPADVGDAENPGWVRQLAFSDEAIFDQYLESRKAPVVDLSEQGSGENEEPDNERADRKLARLAREYHQAHPETSLGEAQNIIRRDNPQVDADYRALLDEQLIRR